MCLVDAPPLPRARIHRRLITEGQHSAVAASDQDGHALSGVVSTFRKQIGIGRAMLHRTVSVAKQSL